MKDEKKESLDFPFYNENPAIKPKDILILASMPILYSLYVLIPNFKIMPGEFTPFVFCLFSILTFLYVARGNISLLIKKPKVRDFVRIIVTLIFQYIFALTVSMIMKFVLHIGMNDNPVIEADMGAFFWIEVVFQLFLEEAYKIFIFLVALILTYKVTQKRKTSIVIAVIISMLTFGGVHLTTYNNWMQVIILQGVASIFCMYNYLKSKNILTSYFQHFLFDAIPFILAMMHVFENLSK